MFVINITKKVEKNITLPKTNIAPETRGSQKETIVFQPPIFQVRAVSFKQGNSSKSTI